MYFLRLHSDDNDYGLPREELSSSAIYPSMPSLQLESHHGHPQVISIKASVDSRGAGVTVQDILRTIHEELRIQITKQELNRLNVEERAELLAACKRRCKTEEELSRGPCRIDRWGGRDRLQILPRLSPDGTVLLPTSTLPFAPRLARSL